MAAPVPDRRGASRCGTAHSPTILVPASGRANVKPLIHGARVSHPRAGGVRTARHTSSKPSLFRFINQSRDLFPFHLVGASL